MTDVQLFRFDTVENDGKKTSHVAIRVGKEIRNLTLGEWSKLIAVPEKIAPV